MREAQHQGQAQEGACREEGENIRVYIHALKIT